MAQARAAEPLVERFADGERLAKLAAAHAGIDAMLAEERDRQGLPGLAAGIVVDGELRHVTALGVRNLETGAPVDADTVFRIGSITKTVTALAVLRLRDEGKLALDDPAARHLPELAGVRYLTADAPPLTLRQLLTHSSGLPRLGAFDYTRPDRDVEEREILDSLRNLSLEHAPGARYAYSNLGYALLGLVVARASGERYRDHVTTKLLAPLGMRASGWDAGALSALELATGYKKREGKLVVATPWRLGASEAAGGLYMSLRDLARWIAVQLDAHPPRDDADHGPVRRASLREAHVAGPRIGLEAHVRGDAGAGVSVEATARAVGLGWHVSETCHFDALVSHGGAVDGFRAEALFSPAHGVGVALLVNSSDASLERPLRRTLELLRASGGLSDRRRLVSPLVESALAALLAVQNRWDEPAYLAMLTERHRAQVTTAEEKAELEEYARRHGRCEAGPAVEVGGPRRARFALSCERGRLEMDVHVADDGRIEGFSGKSYDLAPAPALARVAASLAGLVARWSEPVYARHLAPKLALPRAELVTFFSDLRAAHRACTVSRAHEHLGAGHQSFVLACARDELVMTVRVHADAPEHVVALYVKPFGKAKCR
jgi:CubicO group peptidase (beta-lactamase class C family)